MCNKNEHNYIMQTEPQAVKTDLVEKDGKREWKDFFILHCSKCGDIIKRDAEKI